MLVNSNDILKTAMKDGYAIGAYNINNLEWVKYILEACNDDKSPVILAVTKKSINHFGGLDVVYNVVKSLIKDLNIKVPVVLHLDHSDTVELCKKAIDAGFTSVMLDASKKEFDENVKETIEVIKYANAHNVSVEAELGDMNLGLYTNAYDAQNFVIQTGVNSLAPFIGNKHGIYDKEPTLDFELLGQICKLAKIPLVLHGASGLDDNKIKTAIFCGVSKININTDLQLAWTNSVRKYLNSNKTVYDPKEIIESGKVELKKLVHEKNALFGSKNRAF